MAETSVCLNIPERLLLAAIVIRGLGGNGSREDGRRLAEMRAAIEPAGGVERHLTDLRDDERGRVGRYTEEALIPQRLILSEALANFIERAIAAGDAAKSLPITNPVYQSTIAAWEARAVHVAEQESEPKVIRADFRAAEG